MCRLPEFLIKEGKLFHILGPKTVVALAPESVLVFGTCRSLSRLVVAFVLSLTVGNCRYHLGYIPNTALYIVVHFSNKRGTFI